MNRAVIGVGSNIKPGRYIPLARSAVAHSHRLLAESSFIETSPIGNPHSPAFINGVFLIETEMTRLALKRWLRKTEADLGRIRTADRYAPRTIDLDLVVWNGRIVDPDIYSRDFLRRLVMEVLPDLTI